MINVYKFFFSQFLIFNRNTSICLSGGNQTVFNTKSSMNNANQVSGILNSNLLTHTSLFCVFSNDISSNSKCIFYENDPGTISYTNFIHNTSPSLGVIHVSGGSPKMKYCVFNSNQGILFCIISGSLEVSHSFISHFGTIYTSNTVSIGNNNTYSTIYIYDTIFQH